ncbi:hypothetical protein [Lysobacter sp. FW306-1B-D06B]|uniref:hypothetical protein n=1 Tax=Lysobacter sp. FW306-1B-D06B TaxID=3140250 RepID=UPI0031404B28
MGVGFLVTSTPWKRRTWARPTIAALAQELTRIYRDCLGDPLLSERLTVTKDDAGVWAVWHPAEEGLYIELLDDGRLQAQAKTSTVGPGYHALLVRLLDRMAQDMSVEWDWAAEDEGDESGFALSRDFDALQDEMVKWLAALSSHVADDESAADSESRCSVCMPIAERSPRLAGMIATPMGARTREWFADFATDASVRRAAAMTFFPWWGMDRDAAFWKGIADVLAWCELAWVPPRDESERRTMAFVQACYERAGTESPEREELRELLLREPAADAPRAGPIGYRRGTCTYPLFGGWTVELPGHFQTDVLNDGGNLQLHDGRRAVYVSALKVDGLDAGSAIDKVIGDTQAERWSDHHVMGAAYWDESELETSRHLMTSVAVDGRLLLLTITVEEGEDDAAWAWKTAHSAFHPDLAST